MLEENEEIKWLEIVTNEEVLEHIGEKRTILNNILHRKANWINHILRRRGDGSKRSRKKNNTAPR